MASTNAPGNGTNGTGVIDNGTYRPFPVASNGVVAEKMKSQESLQATMNAASRIAANGKGGGSGGGGGSSGSENIVERARLDTYAVHHLDIRPTDSVVKIAYFFDKVRILATHDVEEKIDRAAGELSDTINVALENVSAALEAGKDDFNEIGGAFEQATKNSTDYFVKGMRGATAEFSRSVGAFQKAIVDNTNHIIESAEKNVATRVNTAAGNSLDAFKQSIHTEAVIAARNAFESEAKNLQALISTSAKARNDIIKAAGDFIEAVKQEREKVKKNWFEVLEDKVMKGNPLAIGGLVLILFVSLAIMKIAFFK